LYIAYSACPEGKVFAPKESVRLNIVGYPEKLEKVGTQNLANYTDEIIQRYNIDSVDSHAYLNRAALVGSKNEELSKNYAKQLCSSSVTITLLSGCFS
jgi:hypothetical protein